MMHSSEQLLSFSNPRDQNRNRRSAFARVLGLVLVLFVFLLVLPATSSAQVVKQKDLVGPFVDGEPFDLIYLNKDGGNAIMKVLPLGDKVPTGGNPEEGQLIFEFFAEGEDLLLSLIHI